MVVDVPVAQTVQVPCIWQSLVWCSVFACGGQDYGFSWASGNIFVFSTLRFDSGHMFGVSLRGLMGVFHTFSTCLTCLSLCNERCMVRRCRLTIEIPQLLVDTMADVPFMLVVQCWLRRLRCTSRRVRFPGSQVHDARHHGRFGPDEQLCACSDLFKAGIAGGIASRAFAGMRGRLFGGPVHRHRAGRSCPQGHGLHNLVHALAFMDKHGCHTHQSAPQPPQPPPLDGEEFFVVERSGWRGV